MREQETKTHGEIIAEVALSDAMGTDGCTTSDMEEAEPIGRHSVIQPHGDCAKLLKTVDLRFDICQDIELVLKIGRDYQNKDGYRGAHYDTVKLLCDAIEYQQEQLKTKTEVGDCAKLRKALELFYNEMLFQQKSSLPIKTSILNRCMETARAALAAPARNCDVGTLDEQRARLKAFCDSHGHGFDGQKNYSCENCQFIDDKECELAWANQPISKEGGLA